VKAACFLYHGSWFNVFSLHKYFNWNHKARLAYNGITTILYRAANWKYTSILTAGVSCSVSYLFSIAYILVYCTITCVLYQHMYTVTTHLHCTITCTLYQPMYTVITHVHCINTCILYHQLYTMPTHVYCTNTCTLYPQLGTVRRKAHLSYTI